MFSQHVQRARAFIDKALSAVWLEGRTGCQVGIGAKCLGLTLKDPCCKAGTGGVIIDFYGMFTPAECGECTADRTAGSKDQLRGCCIIVHPN